MASPPVHLAAANVSLAARAQPVFAQPAPPQSASVPAMPLGPQQMTVPSIWPTPQGAFPPDPMAALMAAMAQLVEKIGDLQTRPRVEREQQGNGGRKELTCWNCGEKGHLKYKCTKPLREQGNAPGRQ